MEVKSSGEEEGVTVGNSTIDDWEEEKHSSQWSEGRLSEDTIGDTRKESVSGDGETSEFGDSAFDSSTYKRE